jgi:hypothetical protein
MKNMLVPSFLAGVLVFTTLAVILWTPLQASAIPVFVYQRIAQRAQLDCLSQSLLKQAFLKQEKT